MVVLAGCARTEHTPVDLQIDVDTELPSDAETVNLCVAAGPWRQFGAAAGRYALTGLFVDVVPEVTVDVLDASGVVIGRVGPVVVAAPYLVASLDECAECSVCSSSGEIPADDEDSLVLGVRFD